MGEDLDHRPATDVEDEEIVSGIEAEEAVDPGVTVERHPSSTNPVSDNNLHNNMQQVRSSALDTAPAYWRFFARNPMAWYDIGSGGSKQIYEHGELGWPRP